MTTQGASLSTYSAYSQSAGTGKIHVPVRPSMVLYSQLEHVSGFASTNDDSGIALKKIQILNSLIDQLVTMKKMPAQTGRQQEELSRLSDGQLDTLIEDYQTKIQATLAQAEANPYALAGVAPKTGALFSIAA